MSKCVIVTEGQEDVLLLRSILNIAPNDLNIRLEAAGGWSAADSYARTVLVENEADVILIVDADSVDPNVVEDRKRFLQRSLSEIPSRRKFRIAVFEPDLTILLFRDRAFLSDLVNRPVTDTDLAAGYYAPKKVLMQLLQGRNVIDVFRDRLPYMDLSPLANDPNMHDIKRFLPRSEQSVPLAS